MLEKIKLTEKQKNMIVKDLSVTPIMHPDYNNDNESFKLYTKTKNHYIVPRYYAEKHFGVLNSDITNTENININFKGDLRDNQKPIVNICLPIIKNIGGGIISVACAGGKTTMSLYIACQLKVKTLVLVHKTFLLDQWVERCRQFTDASIGIIKQKKIDVIGKDIVIGMLQSVSMIDYDPSIFDGFGLVICDECFPSYTQIITDNGLYYIKELYYLWINKLKMPLIKSYNLNTGCYEYNKLTYAWKKDKKSLIRLYFGEYFIDCTPNHKFLTMNGYKEAIDIKHNDILIGNSQTIQITKIINIYPIRNVYDIEVENNHNFIVSYNGFNGAIVHNCHHFGSRVFSQAFSKVASKYTLGLSATPIRKDGLTKVFIWHLGNFMYRATRKADKNVVVKIFEYESNDKLFCEKKKYIMGKLKPCIPIMVTNLHKINARNKFCVNIINSLRKQIDRKILILSGRLEHLKILKDSIDMLINNDIKNGIFEENEQRTAYYIGGMKESQRNEASSCDIIFATFEMAAEGLDIDSLNTLVLATPKKDIVQSIGRIMRKPIKEGSIKPLVIDIADKFSVFPNWTRTRVNHYETQEYTINYYKAYNENCIDLFEYAINKKIILDKTIERNNVDIRKLYICYKEGNDYYENALNNNFEDDPIENYTYNSDMNIIFNIDNDIEEVTGADFVVQTEPLDLM
jgi:superfamily II DNA or RNA helicase